MKKLSMIVTISFILAIHFGLLSGEGFSQTDNSNTQMQGQSDTEKSAILQSQIELMRQYEDRILQTVYWSLGGMITVVVLIAGFGWFANFRLYEHDKKILRQELLQLLTHEMEKIHKELEDTARRAVSREVMEFKTMKYDMLKAEAQKYKDEGVYPNVILMALEMLKVARELDWESRIAVSLDFIRIALKSGKEIDAKLSVSIGKALSDLPNEYFAETENIRELLRSSRS